MILLGGIALTLIALVILALFLSEYSKVAAKKAKDRDTLKSQVEDALKRKDIPALKRIRLMNGSALEEIDKGLGKRLEDFQDDIVIEQDDAKKGQAFQ